MCMTESGAHRGLIAGAIDYPVFVVDYWVKDVQ